MSRDDYVEDLHAELGYRTTGQREVRQREWFSLRGEVDEPLPTPRAFARKVNVLRAMKWAEDNPERRRANANRYAAKPDVRARQLVQAKARNRLKTPMRSKVFICAECDVQFCKAPWTKGPQPRFCRNACYHVNKYHRDHPEARRNKPTKRIYVRGAPGAVTPAKGTP